MQQRQSFVMFDELPETSQLLQDQFVFADPSAVVSQLRDFESSSPSYQAILSQLGSRNLQLSAPEDAPPTGWTVVSRSIDGRQVSSLTIAASLGGSGLSAGSEVGLLGIVVQGVDENGMPVKSERFEIVEIPASGGALDLQNARVTLAVQDGQPADLAAANIFQRLINCVRCSCAKVCLGALTACAGLFPVYLKCVVVACGGCAIKCGACAVCNCGFWCKWATGCCR